MNMTLLNLKISYGDLIGREVRKLISSGAILLIDSGRFNDRRLISDLLNNKQFEKDFTKGISNHLKTHREDYISLRSDVNEVFPIRRKLTPRESYRDAITNEVSKLIAYEGLSINDVGRLIDDMLDSDQLEADVSKAIFEHIEKYRWQYISLSK